MKKDIYLYIIIIDIEIRGVLYDYGRIPFIFRYRCKTI